MNTTNRPGGVPPVARLLGAIVVLLVAAALGIPIMSGGGGTGTGPASPSAVPVPAGRSAPAQDLAPDDAHLADATQPRRAQRAQPARATGQQSPPPPRAVETADPLADPLADLRELIARQVSGEMVTATAEVYRILSDDNDGSRHQRFLIAVGREGRRTLTVKVSHNIDLAPRVPVDEGDVVTIRGQFEWNDLGGVLHWTHHDPAWRREGGWIEHAGRRYE